MISFYLNDRCLASISIEGLTAGEIKATAELLAYENNCNISDIEIR